MKICLVNQYAVPPSQAGITRHYQLGRILVERGHDVSVVAASFDHVTRQEKHLKPGETMRIEMIGGVRFIWLRVPEYSGNSLARLWSMLHFSLSVMRLYRRQDFVQPDVIVGSSPHLFAAFGAERLASRLRVPFVFEVRDLWPESLVHLGRVSERHVAVRMLGAVAARLYRKAYRVIVLLPRASEYLAGKGVPSEKLVWVPNGVDLKQIPFLEHHDPRGRFVLAYAGSHGTANGLEVVLDAAKLLGQDPQMQHVSVQLIGDGPQKESLIQRAETENIANVSFHDPVPKNSIYDRLISVDAFIFVLEDVPLWKYGLSANKLFDYLAMAKPIVFCAQVPQNPVAAARAGIEVPNPTPRSVAEAIKRLASLPPRDRAAMGERGRRYIEQHHDLIKLGHLYEKVLTEVISRAGQNQ